MDTSHSFLALIALPELPENLSERLAEVLVPTFGDAFERDPRVTEGLAGRIGEELIRVVGVPEPIPDPVLEGPLRGAWYWAGAAEALSAHRAHLVAVVKGPAAAHSVLRSLVLTRMCALLLRAFEGIGVFWAGAPSLHSAEAFIASADEMTTDSLPLRLWVDFQVWRNDDGTHSLRTSGLEAFGRHELEIHGSPKDQDEVASWAYNVGHYLLAEDADVEDGHAVGRSPTEWIRVRHVPSVFDPERTVYYLDLEAEE